MPQIFGNLFCWYVYRLPQLSFFMSYFLHCFNYHKSAVILTSCFSVSRTKTFRNKYATDQQNAQQSLRQKLNIYTNANLPGKAMTVSLTTLSTSQIGVKLSEEVYTRFLRITRCSQASTRLEFGYFNCGWSQAIYLLYVTFMRHACCFYCGVWTSFNLIIFELKFAMPAILVCHPSFKKCAEIAMHMNKMPAWQRATQLNSKNLLTPYLPGKM
jgi:hypothetical protein